ncbi:glycine/D-amino acid oxidase-like deaminating enzyme [Tahibacter aquaticus]|uniref:Glycine/D-amino acid oxidase-like deaminating enzyme n=1 Tax=Tahibacter aquaticus TaxID=520092 RepID=A0A4R6YRV8_9GAMM|nr:FAD-binding oxidoreductase [Tahibacter aquaticus]TDR40871.1 glycine/D-amino acid oxidase-like deaminating enzyme [Tahibacter aquaticus]
MPQQAKDESIWRDGRRLALPALVGEERAEVCVIGLGGSGLSAIEALRAANVDVVGLDAGGVAAGAAGANGGFLLAGLAQFHHQAVVRFGHERALAIYRLTRSELECVFATADGNCRRTGSLRIAADADELADCAVQIEQMQRDGLAAEAYDGVEGRGVLIADDGVFDPARRWGELAARLAGGGARMYGRALVHSAQDGVVQTAAGRVRAEAVLVAVDGGLETLLPDLRAEVRSARLQMLATVPAAGTRLARPVYYRDGHDYWQQRDDGCLVVGGGRDIGGEDEWLARDGVSSRVQQHLQALLRQRLGSTAPVTHRWSARVAFTRRGLPVFGRIGPQLYATGAYNGTGNIFGALCGRALAELILGRDNPLHSLLQGAMSTANGAALSPATTRYGSTVPASVPR